MTEIRPTTRRRLPKRNLLFDAELYWIVNEAAGEMGLRAVPLEPSHGALSDGAGFSDAQLAAASRARAAFRALHALDREHQAALLAAHAQMRPGLRHLAARIGLPVDRVGCSLAAVVLLVVERDIVERALDQVCAPRRVREALAVDVLSRSAELISRSRHAAAALLSRAIDAYRDERRRGRLADDEIHRFRERRLEALSEQRPRELRVGRAGLWPLLRREPDWARRPGAGARHDL